MIWRGGPEPKPWRKLTKKDGEYDLAELAEALRAYQAESGRAAFLGLMEDVEPPEPLTGERLAAETVGYPGAIHHKHTPSDPDRGQAVDWIGCLMATVAIVSVLGLVPLWLAVFLRYFV